MTTWSSHVVVWQRAAKKCTKTWNARAETSFCLLNLWWRFRCRRPSWFPKARFIRRISAVSNSIQLSAQKCDCWFIRRISAEHNSLNWYICVCRSAEKCYKCYVTIQYYSTEAFYFPKNYWRKAKEEAVNAKELSDVCRSQLALHDAILDSQPQSTHAQYINIMYAVDHLCRIMRHSQSNARQKCGSRFRRRVSAALNSLNWSRHGRNATYEPGLKLPRERRKEAASGKMRPWKRDWLTRFSCFPW